MAPMKEYISTGSGAKPKLGHAAALFSDATSAPAHSNDRSKRQSSQQIRWAAGVAALLLIAGFFSLQLSHMKPYAIAETITSSEPETKIDVVRDDDGNSQLVGALIHQNEETQLGHNLIVRPAQPIALNKQERERLLQIISN